MLSSPVTFPLKFAIYAHVIGGTVALLTFLIPLLSKKGGKAHVRFGWVYIVGMLSVVMGAFIITPWRIFLDPSGTKESREFALFLMFLALFALNSIQQGMIVLKYKIRNDVFVAPKMVLIPILLFVFSILMWATGALVAKDLFSIFAVIGIVTSIKHFRFWMNPQKHPKDWFIYHLKNMMAACIATVTAFLVTAMPRLMPAFKFDSIWIWILPTIVMVPWMYWFVYKYEKKFGINQNLNKAVQSKSTKVQ